jgi:hypothetical protein
MVDDDADTFTTDEERVSYAIEQLANHPHAAVGACLRGLSPTAIDVIADAADDVLSDIAGSFSALSGPEALRFMCVAFLALRQAKAP